MSPLSTSLACLTATTLIVYRDLQSTDACMVHDVSQVLVICH
jgi:hypothetical protein